MMFLPIFVLSFLGLDQVSIVSGNEAVTRNLYNEGSSPSLGLISEIPSSSAASGTLREVETTLNFRDKRSDSDSSRQCAMPEKSLLTVYKEIESHIGHAVACDVDTEDACYAYDPPDCNDVLDRIKCGINHLASGQRSPFRSRRQCTVSEEALRSLHGEIKSTLAMTRTVSDTNCDIDEHADKCDEILKLIQCGVNHLASGFTQASSNSDDYTKWKNAFDNLSEKFYRQIDDVKRSATQDQQRIIDSIRSQMHDLVNAKLKAALSQLSGTRIKYIISEIAHGRVSSAFDEFKALNDDSLLPDIVKSTYNTYGRINVFENLINFMRKIPNCNANTAGYSAFYNVIKENNDANSPKILLFALDIFLCNCFEDSSLRETDGVSVNVQNVLNSWVTSIRRGQYSEIVDFSRKYSEDIKRRYLIKLFSEDLIAQAHNNDIRNIPNILDFIDDLNLELKINAYNSLYYSCKHADHGVDGPGVDGHEFIMLMYRVKETLDRSDLTSTQRSTLNSLKEDVPRGIMALLWWERISFISKKYPGHFLTLTYSLKTDETIGAVACANNSKHNYLWKVEIYERGRFFKFLLPERKSYNYLLKSPDSLIEVTPVENGMYFYFSTNGEKLEVGEERISLGTALFGRQPSAGCLLVAPSEKYYDHVDDNIFWHIPIAN